MASCLFVILCGKQICRKASCIIVALRGKQSAAWLCASSWLFVVNNPQQDFVHLRNSSW